MSGLEGSVAALEQQLTGLQMQRTPTPGKKVGPPPPPKKNRAQPQVPRSANIHVPSEPSYSTGLNNNPLYTNVPPPPPVYGNISPLAPPLPLPPPCAYDTNCNNEYLPPPSPVSSNYSELARATNPDYPSYHHYSNYPISHSNYESIYEPIEPRSSVHSHGVYRNAGVDNPPHIMQNAIPTATSHSEYALYRSAGDRRPLVADDQLPGAVSHPEFPSYHDRKPLETLSGGSHPPYSPEHNGTTGRLPLAKEEEVDALTDLLVQSIGDSAEPDVYGVCVRCHRKVIGDASGCTAMEQIYHVTCFACARCGVNLQGRPFYAVDGQPHCEEDYLDTLEKCSVCDEPIRDRILRATGKPYHPACFVCVVCGKSLDGVPFTVDATNQIHCIEDFHAKFAPRCCVCSLPIMPEAGQEETVRVVALDRSFHVKCYRCEDCGLTLSSEAEGRGCYPLDDHILCKACNAHRVRMLTNVMTTDL